jgi:flavin reductase (DIM6/NTAB) family NADH-FMN oxidoreductase RutF/DNA-binding IclR family transcriptional regulator
MREASDPTWFRQVLGQYPTGVCAVTAIERDGSATGFVVGSFTSVSLAPPLVAFFPDKASTSWPKIESAKRFCINILSAEQEPLCRQFSAKGVDRFAGINWRAASSGSPIVEGVVAWIDCDLESVSEAGDHYIVVGRVRELDIETPTLPLLFFQGGYGRFAPLSLAASNSHGALTEQLREVDIVRPAMEQLAAELSARCIVTARTGDMLAVTASAGATNTAAAATLVGLRLPFAQPTGSAFAAWMDEAEIEEYLSQIQDPDLREQERARLAAVRERGYSVGLINEAQRTFASVLDRLAEDPEAISHEDLRSLIEDLAYDPLELTVEAKSEIRNITVPVFRADGRVALTFSVYGFPKPLGARGVDEYVERAMAAAQRATERLAGLSGRQSPSAAGLGERRKEQP